MRIQISEWEDKVKRLERENKKLLVQMLDAEKTQDDELQKRLRESLNNERKLSEELNNARKEFEYKLQEYSKRLDEEKEKSRSKIQKLEQLHKESDNKRNMMVFEHEKEKAKLTLDNGQLLSQQNDYLEQIDNLTNKKEFLVRENEKLIAEVKQLRRLTNTGIGSNTLGLFSNGMGMKRDNTVLSSIDKSYSRLDEKGVKNSQDLGNNPMKYSDTFLEKN